MSVCCGSSTYSSDTGVQELLDLIMDSNKRRIFVLVLTRFSRQLEELIQLLLVCIPYADITSIASCMPRLKGA